MAHYTLIGGTKNWSSWTLRPWLLMKMAQIPFDDVEIALRQPATKSEILKISPSGHIPVLKSDDGLLVWDTLAICEYLAEQKRELWPTDPRARAMARSICAEMHAGFAALRREMPMDILGRFPAPELSAQAQGDVERICEIWRDCRAQYGASGDFLFGAFSIADAFYAPVATRFVTYAIALGNVETAYVSAMTTLPAMAQWRDACAAWEARHAAHPPG